MRHVLLASVLALLALSPVATADDRWNADIDNVPIPALADMVLEGPGDRADALAERVEAMKAGEISVLLAAVRDRHATIRRLEQAPVRKVAFDEVSLDHAVGYLTGITGLRVDVSKRTKEEKADDISITLALQDVTAKTLLDLMTRPFGLFWVPDGDVIRIQTEYELERDGLRSTPGDSALRKKLDATTVNLSVENQELRDVLKTLVIQTGFNMIIDARMVADIAELPISMKLRDVSLSTALDKVAHMGGDHVVWVTVGNVIVFTLDQYR